MSSFQAFVAIAVPIATLLGVLGLSNDFAKRIAAVERSNERITGMLIALLEVNQIDPVTLQRRGASAPLDYLDDWADE